MTHGTRYAYRRRCRCPRCRAWKSAEWQRYKASRQARGLPPRPIGWHTYNLRRDPAVLAEPLPASHV